MLEIGEWLKINGESIYGTEAFELHKDQHDWGKITCKQDGNKHKLYLHAFNWPLNKKLSLTGITSIPEKIYLLADKQKSELEFNFSDVFTEISLPNDQPDHYVSVIVVEYSSKPEIIDDLVSKTLDGGYSLLPDNQKTNSQTLIIKPLDKYGTIPQHVIVSSNKEFKWDIYVDSPGEKNIDISYSFQSKESNSSIKVKINDKTIQHHVLPSGQTVGEPNQDWHIDHFKSNRIGKYNFPKKGFYTIELYVEPIKNEEVKFQWLWIK
jgi:alpha-L-fucosidase